LLRVLEASLHKIDGEKTDETDQQIIEELEKFKTLEACYRAVLDEVEESKAELSKITERLSATGSLEHPLSFNAQKRR
jgi:uncharacterized protein YpuA (DUF1002 family)